MPSRVLDGAIMLGVALLSLLLLIYVGYGEASRTYPRFLSEKMAAQGALMQTSVETYLRAGLPLRQFPGFRQLAEPILGSDPTLASIAAWDESGSAFTAGAAEVPRLPAGAPGEPQVRQDGNWLQVAVPLRNRFETVGEITVTMPRTAATSAIRESLPALVGLAVALAAGFALIVFLFGARMRSSRFPWVATAYAACFVAVSAAVVAMLVGLYTEGAQARAKALADSLAQRLKPIVAFDLAIGDFDGLDRTFDEYRNLNPDLRAVALILGERVAIHTDRTSIGGEWHHETDTFEYRAPIGETADGQEIRVAVALPSDIVWAAVARSVKNFAALFLASGLMAGLFLQLGQSMRRDYRHGDHEAALAIVRPVFFLGVFVESLAAGFLPQLLRDSAIAAGAGAGAASMAFTLYFLCFLLVLLPASHAADRGGGRALIVVGAVLAAVGWLLPAAIPSFPVFLLSRAVAGIGQGLLFIGVQSLVLAHAPPGRRTQAAAIIVFGFNGGMISGAAIGSLLVNYIAPAGVFGLGAATACLLALYALVFVVPPPTVSSGGPGFWAALFGLLRNIPRALGSLGFLRAIFLVGAPSKAVLTGVVGFALPLVLSGLGFPPEDIGQVIMLYAGGVLLASGPASRLVDRTGNSGGVLLVGSVVAGIALGMIGLTGWSGLPEALQTRLATTGLLAGGTFLLGLAHGCINAPVITHVAGTSAAERLGANGATALYRILERSGHILGPMLAAQLLVMAGAGTAAILWAGAGILTLALVFGLSSWAIRR